MKTLSQQTIYAGLSSVFINLSSGWFGLVVISPGLLSIPSDAAATFLINNTFFGIVSLIVGFILLEKSK